MTGYQKLKTENEILWSVLKGWLRVAASKIYKEDDPKFQEYVEKEIAWTEKLIKDETK